MSAVNTAYKPYAPDAASDGVGNCAAQLSLPSRRHGLRQQVGEERMRELDAQVLWRYTQWVEDAAVGAVLFAGRFSALAQSRVWA